MIFDKIQVPNIVTDNNFCVTFKPPYKIFKMFIIFENNFKGQKNVKIMLTPITIGAKNFQQSRQKIPGLLPVICSTQSANLNK